MAQADAGMFRLMHDIAECMRDPIDGIQLVVHDNNMRKMCAVLTPTDDAYAGIRLHLSVCIRDNYPASSPQAGLQISIDTPIPHPNIFGSYICCSILKGRLVRNWDTGEVSGTPAYPLQTILAQLLSFFTADVVDQETYFFSDANVVARRERPSRAVLRECVSGFSCSHCGYGPPTGVIRACRSCGAKPRPTPPGAPKSGSASQKCSSCGVTRAFESTPKILSFYPVQQTLSPRPKVLSHRPKTPKSTGHPAAISRVSRSTGDRGSSPCVLDRLLPDIWHMIFLHLGSKDVSTLAAVYPKVLKSVNLDAIVARRNLRCFYLRSDFTESILGVGVQVTPAAGKAIESEVRESPWGQHFSHFLPLAINQAHFERARPGIEAAVMALKGREASNFDPDLIVPTFARWMNQMVVDLMHEVTETETAYGTNRRGGAKPLLHASDKALTGYCALMPLLWYLSRYTHKFYQPPTPVSTASSRILSCDTNATSQTWASFWSASHSSQTCRGTSCEVRSLASC
ncbi:hypothetical protein HK405_006641 [Cladochytrium tenue]|nr:hypothetical protein HK405_006641 [Cladochytrium tenue]